MFKEWLINDIERKAQKSNRVVISDPGHFLTFMVKELTQYSVITLNSKADEMNARLEAQTAHAESKVVFLCFFPSRDITQFMEFAGVGGFINMDNPEGYIRQKLHEALGQNITLPEPKLLLSAKLSIGKSLKWWKGIVTEAIEPLDIYDLLPHLIENPVQFQINNDETVYQVFREELFHVMGKPSIGVDSPTLLRELSISIFSGLISDNIPAPLLKLYYWWSNRSDLIPQLRQQIDSWKLPNNASPLTAHADHPFDAVDRRLIVEIGLAIRNNQSIIQLKESAKSRLESHYAAEFKPTWLTDLITLLEYDSSEIYLYNTPDKLVEYYKRDFAKLDAAMRHLYSHWLAESEILKPLQELYEQHLKALLNIWFEIMPGAYSPSQFGLIENALSVCGKVAVIVGDGLRLEIAETIANRLGSSVETRRNVRYAKLPSVTGNGMSALFGIDEVVNSTSLRYNNLRDSIPNVDIIQYDNFGSNTNSEKLVIMFGDIDAAGEHKGMAALRDINAYEEELAKAVMKLHRLGYSNVFITADHGFVITGLLDEASKLSSPHGVDVKERFFLTDDFIASSPYVRREDDFPGGRYQYYAKTDLPFRTRGMYGYAHGGFTPQECLIPFYRFMTLNARQSVEVEISDKSSLLQITGQYFSVYLKGNDAAKNNRVKISLLANGSCVTSNIVKLNNTGTGSAEFELNSDEYTLIVQDTTSNIQLDSAIVRKSQSRDLDDLF